MSKRTLAVVLAELREAVALLPVIRQQLAENIGILASGRALTRQESASFKAANKAAAEANRAVKRLTREAESLK